MLSTADTENFLRQKKLLVLLCGVVIFFLTSMAKVLIPATIFQDLLKSGMAVNRISSLGAAFLYAYAASQLVMGCFSDRYGGVRILLIGGTMFAGGTMLFPLMNNYFLMIAMRIITGFGAGTIFLGVAKLLGDLFPGKFSMMLGTVLFFSYLGPTTGTVPMVKLVELIGWKTAMILPGAVAAVPLILILLLSRGLIVPVTPGSSIAPLCVMIRNKQLWFACFACASVYGSYYALVGQLGQKIFVDLYHFATGKAALCIMILTVLVAVNNMTVNFILKLFHNRRKAVILLGAVLSLAGTLTAQYSFYAQLGAVCFIAATVLTAFPAGFFPMFSLVAKELNDVKYTAMSIAFINFMAFVFISFYQNSAGWILKMFPPEAGSLAFSLRAYNAVYIFFTAGAIVSLIAAALLKETRNN